MGLNKEKIQHRVQDALELLGIEHLRERTPYTLSGGNKKDRHRRHPNHESHYLDSG